MSSIEHLSNAESDALDELVHEQASVAASNAINNGDQAKYLLSNGWSESDIRSRLDEMVLPEDRYREDDDDKDDA